MAEDLMAHGADRALLAFTPEEQEILSAAATVIAQELQLERLHGPDASDLSPSVRQGFAELGWFGLVLPEASGGAGLSAVEHALFFRELGRQCGPIDMLAQALAANAAIADDELRVELLAGNAAAALATPDERGYRVLGAPTASIAVLVEPDGAAVFDIAGLDADERPSLDPATTMRVCSELGPQLCRRSGQLVSDLGQLGVAAMLVGLGEAALDLITEYAKVRETFGRKIGSYQAVRHPCADMAVRVEAARSQLWYAAASLKSGRADARAQLDAAKHLANEAALANADANIQLHGGIGVTDEHSAHLLLKRSLLLSRLFGSRRQLLDRLLPAQLLD